MLRRICKFVIGIGLFLIPLPAFAQVSVHANSTITAFDNGGADASVSVSPPTGLASGDTWVIGFCADTNRAGAESLQDISGFTGIVASQIPTGGVWPVARMWYKVAGASESAVNVTSAAGVFWGSNYMSVRLTGTHATTPFDTSALTNANSAATSTDVSNLTVANNNSMALLMYCHANTASPTLPTGTTAIGGGTGLLTSPGTGFAYQAVNAGTYDPAAWTHASVSPRLSIVAVFAPAGGAAAVPRMSLLGVGP